MALTVLSLTTPMMQIVAFNITVSNKYNDVAFNIFQGG